MAHTEYEEGNAGALWWKVALHLDEAQLSLANALAHNVDNLPNAFSLQDRLREAQALLLEIFRAKGLVPMSVAGAPPSPSMPPPMVPPMVPSMAPPMVPSMPLSRVPPMPPSMVPPMPPSMVEVPFPTMPTGGEQAPSSADMLEGVEQEAAAYEDVMVEVAPSGPGEVAPQGVSSDPGALPGAGA